MRKKGFFSSVLMLLVIGALGAAAYVFFKDMDGPAVAVSPETDRISPSSVLTIAMSDPSGIRSLSVGIRKNNVVNTIFSKHFDQYLTERTVEVPFKDAGLREGAFELEIKATDASLAGFGQGNTRTELRSMRLDTQPPRISVKTLPPLRAARGLHGHQVHHRRGRRRQRRCWWRAISCPVTVRRTAATSATSPFPYTMTAVQYKNAVEITATDLAGNTTRNRLTVMALERKFKSDSINISDDFLMSVQNKLGHLAPQASSPLDCYLTINNNVRAANVEALRELSRDTVAGQLWDGTFTRLPRSAPRAGFADHRFFSYQGKQVGESYHLGFDLASVRNADIPRPTAAASSSWAIWAFTVISSSSTTAWASCPSIRIAARSA